MGERERGRSAPGWRLALVAALLGGCGDSLIEPPPASPVEATPAAAITRSTALPAAHFDPAATPIQVAAAAAHRTDAYLLVLMNERAVHRDSDELAPTQGRGYQALEAFVFANGRPRAASPVASIKPTCLPTECRYLPPRQAGRAESYVISIDDESVAELTAVEDRVRVSPRQLAWALPAVVQVTLTVPGQPPVVRRIVYGAAPG
jgi:hypothetical protein